MTKIQYYVKIAIEDLWIYKIYRYIHNYSVQKFTSKCKNVLNDANRKRCLLHP